MYSAGDTAEAVGCPIRKSTDQGLLAAPHGLSQRAASFIASQCQGIHQMPFIRLFYTYECATRRRKPTRDQRQPARIRQRCIVMTQPAVPPCEATALSGHPRSLILFTCQRSHIRRSGYLCSLSRISRRLALAKRLCRVIEGHRSSLPVLLVEADGIEPTTSCLQSTRSPN